MSYLPYSNTGVGSWIAATGSSILVHAGVVALTFGGLQQLFQPTEAAQPPDTNYTITLEQLDSDTLAGLVERLGQAGAEGEELEGTDPDSIDPAGAEELAALQPEDTLEGTEPEATDSIEPDVLEAEPEPESIEPLPEPETVEAEPEAETLEPLPEPETVEADPELENIEALPEAETVEAEPDLETLEPLPEPETVEALPEAETLEASESEQLPTEEIAALEPVVPAAPTTEALSPIEVDPGPLIPETATPVSPGAVAAPPTAETLTALAPAPRPNEAAPTLRPTTVAPTATTATRVAPTAAAPQAVQPSAIRPETVAAARPQPPRPSGETSAPAAQRPAAPPPSAQDLAVGDLIRRIRTAVADACLLALPRRDGEDGVGLALIAATDQAMAEFSSSVLTGEDADVRQTRTLVDPRQCPAVTYIRQNRDYPATRLGVRLDSPEVPSGGRLTGTLRGTAGRYVVLLLVDNNGVVQDLQRFLSFSGNFARFDVPVTRSGPPRDTSQMLLAIATDRPPNVIRDRTGQLAQDVFAGLDGDFADRAALAIVTFDVR